MVKKIAVILAVILILCGCSQNALPSESSESPVELTEHDPISEKLAKNRGAVLEMLKEASDPLELIANPSENEPVTFVYDEKSAGGVPKSVYELVYAYYNTFVTLETPDFSAFGELPELAQQLRLRVAKLRKQNIVLSNFSVGIEPFQTDSYADNSFSGIVECVISWEAESGATGKENLLLWINLYGEGESWVVEAFKTMQVGYGGVYGSLDTDFTEVSGRYPEFKGDVQKLASAGICEIALVQSY